MNNKDINIAVDNISKKLFNKFINDYKEYNVPHKGLYSYFTMVITKPIKDVIKEVVNSYINKLNKDKVKEGLFSPDKLKTYLSTRDNCINELKREALKVNDPDLKSKIVLMITKLQQFDSETDPIINVTITDYRNLPAFNKEQQSLLKDLKKHANVFVHGHKDKSLLPSKPKGIDSYE